MTRKYRIENIYVFKKLLIIEINCILYSLTLVRPLTTISHLTFSGLIPLVLHKTHHD